MFHGSIVALVTPMHADGSIDYGAVEELIEWHIASETDGLVILGSTGEAATIKMNERSELIQRVINQVHDRLPVIVGTGSNCTAHTIELTQHAMEIGADAALIVTPYYNKPTQEGLFQHFSMVAKKVPIPQIVYNVPSRTGCDMLPETILRLCQYANIVGVKEATGDLNRVAKLLDSELDLFSGDDATFSAFILAGGKGVISVAANVVPNQIHQICIKALEKDQQGLEQVESPCQKLYKALFCESNPIPVKWALAKMGRIEQGIRLPLTPLSEKFHNEVRDALQQAGCLKVGI